MVCRGVTVPQKEHKEEYRKTFRLSPGFPPSHPEFVPQFPHPIDNRTADCGDLLRRQCTVRRAHRQPERDALRALRERRSRLLPHKLNLLHHRPPQPTDRVPQPPPPPSPPTDYATTEPPR